MAMEFVSPEGLRVDGRRSKEIRRVRCQLGVLDAPDGSALVEMGNTKVLAAVYGPHEVTNRSQLKRDRAIIKCEYSMASFSTADRRRQRKMDRRSQELSLVIGNTIEQTVMVELLPRTQIEVYLQVLQADGGTRCACINAATLALAAAGIPLKDLTVAVAAGFLDGTALLDLNYLEDSGGGPDVSVAYQPRLDRIVLLQMDSKLSQDTFEEVVNLALEGCKILQEHMRTELLKYTEQLVVARGVLQGGAGRSAVKP